MKVIINAAAAKMGGHVTYITHLLRHLSQFQNRLELLVFLPPKTIENQEALPENVRLFPTRIGYAGWWKRLWWDQITLRHFLTKQRADVLFSTGNYAMFACPVRQLLLVRDALYFSGNYQEMFMTKHDLRARLVYRLRRWLICQSVRSADVVMTPTQAMLDCLRSYAEVRPEKTVVNPYGVEVQDAFRLRAEGEPGDGEPQVPPFVRLLYVSLYAEHKNLNTVLKALPILNRNGGRRFVLQTTADPGWEGARWTVTHKADLALALQPEVRQWVEFVGPVRKGLTQELYRGADIFVFPSLIESFGFPLVEAMAYGLPIVASDTLVNREVCGDAAVYFSPLSAEELASQVYRVATDNPLRRRISAAARQRAATLFRWDKHAARILECWGVYRRQEIQDPKAVNSIGIDCPL